jgi:PAS domain S-box-containing protein
LKVKQGKITIHKSARKIALKGAGKRGRPAKPVKRPAQLSVKTTETKASLRHEIAELRSRLSEAEETLEAIRHGEIDALVVSGPRGDQVYALQGAEHSYRILVESMNEGALTLTKSGEIIYCNKAFAEMAHIPCGKLIGVPFGNLVSENYRESFGKLWKNALQAVGTDEIELNFDGRRMPVYLSCSSRVQDEILSVFAIATDISERKLTEAELAEYRLHLEQKVDQKTVLLRTLNQELKAANEDLEAFCSSISHDLRAPLRHIAGFVDRLQKKLEHYPDKETHRYCGMIFEASKTMGLLIDGLLNFSRLGRSEMTKRKVSLNSLVKDVLKEIREELTDRTINWTIDELPDVMVDRQLLRLVLVNLISNAVKFTGPVPQTEIRVACSDDGDKFTISIADNGVGFDMQYADRLFGVFQRLHTQDEFEGTGIGLANVQRIILRHGGKVWAEAAVGQGATFYFTIPKSATE